MPSCMVRLCGNRCTEKSVRQKNREAILKHKISFHRFPQDSDLKKKWLAAVCRPNVSRTGVICSEHFATDNFLRSNRSQLIGKAFPTLKIPIMNLNQQGNSESTVRSSPSYKIENENDSTNQFSTVNAIPQHNIPETNSLHKFEEIEFVDSQNIDPLGDNQPLIRLSIATQSNWPGDKEFRFNFLDLLTTDCDLYRWTGLKSFDTLHTLEKRIPKGESVAATYGMSLSNLIVMVMVRIKMNIPFEHMTVLFPVKTALLTKCFSEFLPILEEATRISIPPIAKSQVNCTETILLLEHPAITTIGNFHNISTTKNAIRVNPAGKNTAGISTSVTLPQTSSARKVSTQQQDSECNTSANNTSVDLMLEDSTVFKVEVREIRISPPLSSTTSASTPIIPAKTEQCQHTIESIKSFRILNEKVAPSMTLYMGIIVRLICGVINFNKATSISDTILEC